LVPITPPLSLFSRVWLRGLTRVLLQSPWETRQAAIKCVSEVIALRPVMAEWMLGDLEEITEKVTAGKLESCVTVF
jgi:hypothetical protein